jgi:hypothetical protein
MVRIFKLKQEMYPDEYTEASLNHIKLEPL